VSPSLEVRISEGQQPVYATECVGAVSLGRRDKGDSDRLFSPMLANGVTRIVIAPSSENTIPREIVIEPLDDGYVRLNNRSTTARIAVHGENALEPLGTRETSLPVLLSFGSRAVRIQAPTPPDEVLHCLPEATIAPGSRRSGTPLPSVTDHSSTDYVRMVRWLQSVLYVVQGAAASDELRPTYVDVRKCIRVTAAIFDKRGGHHAKLN
jgi:hypothetical protein